MNQKQVQSAFTGIYKTNHWGSPESVSGPGSTVSRTTGLRNSLQDVLKRYGIESMLDLPCGDFNWMKHVNLSGIRYMGADIVKELVMRNQQLYSSKMVQFQELDVVASKLPKVDLIFCRDVLVHLSDDMVKAAIENIKRSNSTYLMTTTFPDIKNSVKGSVGGWRPVNLCDSKFGLKKPDELIIEGSANKYGKKAMGIWYIGDL